jgi:hypothetical protein
MLKTSVSIWMVNSAYLLEARRVKDNRWVLHMWNWSPSSEVLWDSWRDLGVVVYTHENAVGHVYADARVSEMFYWNAE